MIETLYVGCWVVSETWMRFKLNVDQGLYFALGHSGICICLTLQSLLAVTHHPEIHSDGSAHIHQHKADVTNAGLLPLWAHWKTAAIRSQGSNEGGNLGCLTPCLSSCLTLFLHIGGLHIQSCFVTSVLLFLPFVVSYQFFPSFCGFGHELKRLLPWQTVGQQHVVNDRIAVYNTSIHP